MSASLVRKSLEILGYDKDLNQGKKKKTRKSKGALDLLPANHRIITKRGKKEIKVILDPSKKITVSQAKKQLESKTDPTESNIQKLIQLSSSRLDSETADKLLNRAVNRRYIYEEKPEQPEETVFTDADFKEFERDYTEQ